MGKGVSWGLLGIFLATAVIVARKRGNLRADCAVVTLPLPLLLSASVILSWIVMTKVDATPLWTLAYQYVPGGGGVRTPFRYNLTLIFSVTAVAAVGLDALWRRSRNIIGRAAILTVCLFLVAEQTCDTPSRQGREDYARLDTIPLPPSSCASFVIDPFSLIKGRRYTHRQLDAVLLSLRVGVPTLNGHSGHTPPGWTLSDPENTQAYLEGLRTWADRFNLWDGLCAVDIERGAWRTINREEVISARPQLTHRSGL